MGWFVFLWGGLGGVHCWRRRGLGRSGGWGGGGGGRGDEMATWFSRPLGKQPGGWQIPPPLCLGQWHWNPSSAVCLQVAGIVVDLPAVVGCKPTWQAEISDRLSTSPPPHHRLVTVDPVLASRQHIMGLSCWSCFGSRQHIMGLSCWSCLGFKAGLGPPVSVSARGRKAVEHLWVEGCARGDVILICKLC